MQRSCAESAGRPRALAWAPLSDRPLQQCCGTHTSSVHLYPFVVRQGPCGTGEAFWTGQPSSHTSISLFTNKDASPAFIKGSPGACLILQGLQQRSPHCLRSTQHQPWAAPSAPPTPAPQTGTQMGAILQSTEAGSSSVPPGGVSPGGRGRPGARISPGPEAVLATLPSPSAPVHRI